MLWPWAAFATASLLALLALLTLLMKSLLEWRAHRERNRPGRAVGRPGRREEVTEPNRW